MSVHQRRGGAPVPAHFPISFTWNRDMKPFFDFVLVESLKLATYMIFIFSIVTGMEGVKFSVKRYRRLAAVVSFLVFFLFGFFALEGLRIFTILQVQALPFTYNGRFIFMETSVAPYFYAILVGVIFMIIGLVMYEKRAEI